MKVPMSVLQKLRIFPINTKLKALEVLSNLSSNFLKQKANLRLIFQTQKANPEVCAIPPTAKKIKASTSSAKVLSVIRIKTFSPMTRAMLLNLK